MNSKVSMFNVKNEMTSEVFTNKLYEKNLKRTDIKMRYIRDNDSFSNGKSFPCKYSECDYRIVKENDVVVN